MKKISIAVLTLIAVLLGTASKSFAVEIPPKMHTDSFEITLSAPTDDVGAYSISEGYTFDWIKTNRDFIVGISESTEMIDPQAKISWHEPTDELNIRSVYFNQNGTYTDITGDITLTGNEKLVLLLTFDVTETSFVTSFGDEKLRFDVAPFSGLHDLDDQEKLGKTPIFYYKNGGWFMGSMAKYIYPALDLSEIGFSPNAYDDGLSIREVRVPIVAALIALEDGQFKNLVKGRVLSPNTDYAVIADGVGYKFVSSLDDPEALILGETYPVDQYVLTFITKDLYDELTGLRPAISGKENFVTNIDSPQSIEYFQSFITAFDETDGDLTDSITVKTDNYTANKNKLGVYEVVFSVTDSSGNEATLSTYIHVMDITNPTINGSTTIANIGYKETFNIANFKATLTVTDNYDKNILPSDITIKNDGYTANKTKIGVYEIVFSVLDSSGNEATFVKRVKVIDNVKPTFSGPTVIATNNGSILTESDVRAQLTASDEIDGNLTSAIRLIEDKYSGYGNAVGNYTITYAVTDSSGNEAIHVVTLQRKDNLPPVYMIKDGVSILIEQPGTLTKQQIIDILVSTGQLSVNAQTQVTFLYNEYEGNEEVPGVYAVSLRARSASGNESVHNLAITVLEAENEDDVIVTPPTTGEKIETFFKENPLIIILVAFIGIIVIVKIFKKRK